MKINASTGQMTPIYQGPGFPPTARDGPIQNSTVTYAVNGKQYLAVMTGSGLVTGGLIDQAGIKPNRGYKALYVYAPP